MRYRLAVPISLLIAVVLAGCADTDAAADGGHSPSATDSASFTSESEHALHGHGHTDVPVEVSLTPTCVTPGGTVTVTVQTAPRTGVLYLAYFSDDKSGAKQPLGAGYGGNGGGYADEDGHFEESWTLSDDAPPGPGRLRILTVASGSGEYITFEVADSAEGGC